MVTIKSNHYMDFLKKNYIYIKCNIYSSHYLPKKKSEKIAYKVLQGFIIIIFFLANIEKK